MNFLGHLLAIPAVIALFIGYLFAGSIGGASMDAQNSAAYQQYEKTPTLTTLATFNCPNGIIGEIQDHRIFHAGQVMVGGPGVSQEPVLLITQGSTTILNFESELILQKNASTTSTLPENEQHSASYAFAAIASLFSTKDARTQIATCLSNNSATITKWLQFNNDPEVIAIQFQTQVQ